MMLKQKSRTKLAEILFDMQTPRTTEIPIDVNASEKMWNSSGLFCDWVEIIIDVTENLCWNNKRGVGVVV